MEKFTWIAIAVGIALFWALAIFLVIQLARGVFG